MNDASGLRCEPRITHPDDLYEALLSLNTADRPNLDRPLLAALVLLLANHIGDIAVVQAAITKARQAFDGCEEATT